LGVWQLFETNDLILDGHDPFADQVTDPKARKRLQGYCVMENPPFILSCRSTMRGGRLQCVDVANYGIDDLLPLMSDNEVRNGGIEDGMHIRDAGQLVADAGERAVRRFWTGYVEMCIDLSLGAVQNTAASQALHGYRRSYMKDPILVHDCQLALDME